MDNQLINSVVTVATAIVGVAILAVLVSKNAKTADVISSAGNAFSQSLGTAVSPITGQAGGMNFGSSYYGLGSGYGLGQY